MKDVQHEKFAQMMAEVEAIEDEIAALAKDGSMDERIKELRGKLAEARNRLTQVSDGCGTGHSHSV